jgi:hypothetical protein
VPLVLAQWALVAGLAVVVRHNGWLFYQGGDETFYYTGSWVLAHAHIPEAEIGFGLSYLLSPLALLAGANYLSALPVVVVLQTVVLLPIAVYCVYAIAARFGDRSLGYLAAALWVAGPFALIPLFDQRFHEKYVENFLPQAFGLTGLADFPSLVCLLVAALFCLRALERADPADGLVAGIAAGFAIGIKPANALFLAGPALAFATARQLRTGLAFALALLPGVLALALWKYRGLGHLPLTTPTPSAVAAGHDVAGPAGSTLSRYLNLDWSRLKDNFVQLRAFLPLAPVFAALTVAGLLGALRRSIPYALLLFGWVGAFILVKGTSDQANIEGGTLLRLFMPGFPPLLIFTALVPLLWRESTPYAVVARAVGRWTVGVTAAIFGIAPLVLFLSCSPLHDRTAVKYFAESVMVPVDRSFEVNVRRGAGGELLTWRGAQRSRAPSSVSSAFAPPVPHRIRRCRPRATGSAASPSRPGAKTARTTAGSRWTSSGSAAARASSTTRRRGRGPTVSACSRTGSTTRPLATSCF